MLHTSICHASQVADARAGGAGKGLLSDKTLYMLTHVALTLTGVIFQVGPLRRR